MHGSAEPCEVDVDEEAFPEAEEAEPSAPEEGHPHEAFVEDGLSGEVLVAPLDGCLSDLEVAVHDQEGDPEVAEEEPDDAALAVDDSADDVFGDAARLNIFFEEEFFLGLVWVLGVFWGLVLFGGLFGVFGQLEVFF